jgi:hypothetical protein
MVRVPVVVEVLQLVRFEQLLLDGIRGPKAVFHGDPGLQLPQLGVHHRPQVARRVVMEFDDATGLTFEHDGHAPADVGGGNRHCSNPDGKRSGAHSRGGVLGRSNLNG